MMRPPSILAKSTHWVSKALSSIAPAMFIIGYVIGTGSVTAMSVAGAHYGLNLLWTLLLSCLFTFVLLSAISRLTIVSGNTVLYNIRKRIHPSLAVLLLGGLFVSVISSVVGVMGVVTEILQEWSRPFTPEQSGWSPVVIASLLSGFLYVLFLTGQHPTFLKVVSVLVALMGIAFLLTNFLVVTHPEDIVQGLLPTLPLADNTLLVLSGMVGTTMAAVVLVSRSILVQERGWTVKEFRQERQDAALSMFLTFLISGSIMVSAAGTMYAQDIRIDNAVDMVVMLEPLAGRLAVSLFVVGILCAGLSSIFPNLLLIPWLITDYRHQRKQPSAKQYRLLVFAIAISTLIIPVFGGKPVFLLIASQALSPLMMPLLVALLIWLLNNPEIMGHHRANWLTNATLGVTFLFTLFTFFTAWQGLLTMI